MENDPKDEAPKTGITFILIVGLGASCLVLIGFILNASTNSTLGSGIGAGLIGMGASLQTSAFLRYLKVRKANKS